jgi:predicted HNH restriction endonuclease
MRKLQLQESKPPSPSKPLVLQETLSKDVDVQRKSSRLVDRPAISNSGWDWTTTETTTIRKLDREYAWKTDDKQKITTNSLVEKESLEHNWRRKDEVPIETKVPEPPTYRHEIDHRTSPLKAYEEPTENIENWRATHYVSPVRNEVFKQIPQIKQSLASSKTGPQAKRNENLLQAFESHDKESEYSQRVTDYGTEFEVESNGQEDDVVAM